MEDKRKILKINIIYVSIKIKKEKIKKEIIFQKGERKDEKKDKRYSCFEGRI